MRVLLVGAGGREHAIGETLKRSEADIFVAAPTVNPGLKRIAREYAKFRVEDGEAISAWGKRAGAEVAVLGPDAAVAAGVADQLRKAGIPTVGPGAEAAKIEASKAYARAFLEKHGIMECPAYKMVKTADELESAVRAFPEGQFVVKPSGLTGGKGVVVGGRDFKTSEEGSKFARAILAEGKGAPVVLEELLEGEEFSLMAFVDGKHSHPMPLVQDYKRAFDGDQGGNTGGMGSYSVRDWLLPFVSTDDYNDAAAIMERTVSALREEGLEYRGILYGGFMLTKSGPRVLEFNARFGDPECLNLLTIYDSTDFSDLMLGIATGSANPAHITFRKRATVVKYLVPPGYGSAPQSGGVLEVDEGAIKAAGTTLYYSSVTPGDAPDRVVMGTSRAVALVGEGSALKDALARVDDVLHCVKGTYSMRHDIASAIDVKKRVDHMRSLRPGKNQAPAVNHTRSGPQPPTVFT